jgi:uncharacterized protein (TIGR02271 family)
MREEFVIERIPAGQATAPGGPGIATAFQGREIYLPLMREEPVASKRTLLTETVTVGKRIETDREMIRHPVRSEDVEVVKNPDLSDARFTHLPRRALPSMGQESLGAVVPRGEVSPDSIRLAKEELIVGKRPVDNGGVFVQKVVRTDEASVPVDLRREEFHIDRQSAGNQPVSDADFAQREFRIDLAREQAVVGTRNFVTEIVRLRKQTHVDTQTVAGAVRKESLEIVKNAGSLEPAQVGTVGSAFQAGTGASSSLAVAESSITGKAVCGKCQLKTTAECRNAIQVKTDGATAIYFLAGDQVPKDFHDRLCRQGATVTATGVIRGTSGQMELVASRVAAVE